MKIRCKKSKRFLCEVNIEEYLKHLKEAGISQEIPLKIAIPCRICKKVEEYAIYEEHYVFISNK